jgi:tungstate transport system permease protein
MGIEYLTAGVERAASLLLTLDPYVISVTEVQLLVSITAVALAALTAVPLAVLIVFREFPGKRLVLAVINAGMGLPPVVVGLVVFILFYRLGPLGFTEILYTKKAMILAQYLLATPIILGISIAVIKGVPKSIKELAFTLGGARKDVALAVIREARYGIATAVLGGAGRVFAEVGAILTVGGNIAYALKTSQGVVQVSKTRTLSTAIPIETSQGDIAAAISFGIILLGITLALNLAVSYLQGRAEIRRNQ